MNTGIRALTAGALAAITASVAISALTGAQASPARSARTRGRAHPRPISSARLSAGASTHWSTPTRQPRAA
jgi:hypothetical protein